MTENKRFIIYMGEPYYNNVFFKYDESADDYQFLCRTSDFGSILEELNALADEIEQKNETNQKLYDKLQVIMSRNSLNMGEIELLKKENKQLKKEKESWKSSACNNSSFNSILLHELDIAQEQGYKISDPFKKLMEGKNDQK